MTEKTKRFEQLKLLDKFAVQNTHGHTTSWQGFRKYMYSFDNSIEDSEITEDFLEQLEELARVVVEELEQAYADGWNDCTYDYQYRYSNKMKK